MFDKIKEKFETYSSSSNPTYKDNTLRPVYFKMGASYLADRIIEILKKLKYKEILYNDSFNEIFTSKAGYEVTISLIAAESGSTMLNVAIFAPTHRGKTRKALRFLLHTFKEELNGSTGDE